MIPEDKSKYDTVLKHLTSLCPKAFAKEFCPSYDGEEVSLFSESLSISERKTDRVIALKREQPCLFHSEFEKSVSDMSKRAFEYFSLLYIKYDIIPIPVVLFLEGTEKDGWREFELTTGNMRIVHFRYYAVFLSSHNYNDYLNKEAGLAPLALLMNVPLERRKEVFAKCVDKIKHECSGKFRDDLLRITALFADLKWGNPSWIESSIDISLLKESDMIMELVREAEKRAKKEGMLKEAKDLALEGLKERFGDITPELQKMVQTTKDRKILQAIIMKSIKGCDLNEITSMFCHLED